MKQPVAGSNHATGGKARAGHRSTRAKNHARNKAKASRRITPTPAIKRPRLGRLNAIARHLNL